MNAAYRQMYILSQLGEREPLVKLELAAHFEVSARTIQRDISQLNQFFDHEDLQQTIKYDRSTRTYTMAHSGKRLSDRQLLAIIKILLSTRGLNLEEMTAAIDGLRDLVSPEQHMLVDRIIQNERHNFVPLHHGQDLIDLIWDFSNFIQTQRAVVIDYTDRIDVTSYREIIPKAIFFSETYFYVIATDSTTNQDRFFRADRIIHYHRSNTTPASGNRNQYNEGELRKHIQFMYGGKLEQITFEFFGIVEAALDRLPTAKIIERHKDSVIIQAEVYGSGIQMWLLSQGDKVRVLSPQSLIDDMVQTMQATLKQYNEQS